MKHLRRSILATLLAVVFASPVLAADIFGQWVRPSTGAQVSFYDCGGKLCAKIVASKNNGEIGTVILNGAVKSGENAWKGNLLNTENGKTYAGVVMFDGGNKLSLKGCALGIICEGETWNRVK